MRRFVCAFSTAVLAAALSAQERPDVVLVMADDVGVEAFSCYGGESYRTPNLDDVAAEGVRFTHCYSQPLCTPSRVKLMTGMSNLRNYASFGNLPKDQTTFAHLLQRTGYATCVVGKWQLYGARPELEPIGAGTLPGDAGFDEHCLWQVDRIGKRYADPLIVRNGEYLEDTEGKYGPDVFTDHAIDFIRRQRAAKRPYLLYFPMALVHSPFEAPPGTDPGPQGPSGRPQRFAAMMEHMDGIVGRLLKAIDDAGGRERTLFVFTSDNGTARGITSRRNGADVRGGKGLPLDRGTHVPLLARWPGTVPEGRVDDALIDFSDFLPTLCEVAGVAPPPELELDGRSFLARLRGEEGDPRPWVFVYYNPRPEREGSARGRFARDHEWKLYGDGRLFHVAEDPEEQRPIPDGGGGQAAAAARRKLAAAIASMPEHPARIAEKYR